MALSVRRSHASRLSEYRLPVDDVYTIPGSVEFSLSQAEGLHLGNAPFADGRAGIVDFDFRVHVCLPLEDEFLKPPSVPGCESLSVWLIPRY